MEYNVNICPTCGENTDRIPEDYMVGKIAELLYVARGDVIRLRNRVYESLGE